MRGEDGLNGQLFSYIDMESRIHERHPQRLVLQPSFEVNLAAQDTSGRGIGSGVSDIELGLRLRYEIRREFAPYIGVNWERKLGQTADIARRGGEDAGIPSLVAGIRFWF